MSRFVDSDISSESGTIKGDSGTGIILDDREHGLREIILQAGVLHLPVGDIWIGDKKNGLVIERKSAADLEASILDNRYREQRQRLLSYCKESESHPIYIIEGSLERCSRLKKPALMKHISRLALRYHVTVFQTASLKETADLCLLLADQLKSDPTTFEQPANLSYVESRGKTRESNSDDPKIFATSVLMCCRGVSSAAAQAVLEGCGGSLSGVWTADESKLAGILCGKQKFGPARAKRLHSLLHQGQDSPPS